ncbi:MAG: bifunctional folylpolyglutamate synthase/dihydrofolate synthase [Sporocytophaga sp.]|nr:folylpolyglutamate synthase/dihydrofolate synthase family protein [Sporocytophaga sp.]MBO9700662.1 bifunctional folylpolyglutamate synthase/dihydrofolate synthase [Sporocytophaga sp.]
MFEKVGSSALKSGLDNISALCEALNNPQNSFPSVHIAGTNGKGSSSHFLAAVLQSAGYKVGLFTSPHLKSFAERIKVNGENIPEEVVVDFVQSHKGLFEKLNPSFFEMTTILGFDYFRSQKVDIAIIETGLGGRLDSTNIVQPLVSLITNISLDHQNILGDTLPQIAGEKAGIIKTDIPVVLSERQESVADVFIQVAQKQKSPITFASSEFSLINKRLENGNLILDIFHNGNLIYKDLRSGLPGLYQLKNLAGVLKTAEILNQKGFEIDETAIRKGIKEVVALTGLKGRWQVLGIDPMVVCDTGHNEAGIKEVLNQLKCYSYKRLFIVFGMVKDKDVSKILTLLPKDAIYYFCMPKIPRALEAEILFQEAVKFGLKGTVEKDVNVALQKAQAAASQDDFIFIGGSTFVVSELDNL